MPLWHPLLASVATTSWHTRLRANAIATTVHTRALSPRRAIILASSMNFIGALVSEKVAKTISSGLVDISLPQYVILAALIGAIIWDLFTWWNSIPTSSSHALIGGLLGATIAFTMGTSDVLWSGVVQKVIIPLFTSPIVGAIIAFILMKIVFGLFANMAHSKANKLFLRLQILSASLMAYSHGNNDAQKTMGIITMALVSQGILTVDDGVPLWVKVICAFTMAMGTSVGGWRIMTTMGRGVTKLRPANGFVAETTAALVIEGASFIGAPVSTTQIITSSVVGVGAATRISGVKWSVTEKILIAWIFTLPSSMIIGAIAVKIIELFV